MSQGTLPWKLPNGTTIQMPSWWVMKQRQAQARFDQAMQQQSRLYAGMVQRARRR